MKIIVSQFLFDIYSYCGGSKTPLCTSMSLWSFALMTLVLGICPQGFSGDTGAGRSSPVSTSSWHGQNLAQPGSEVPSCKTEACHGEGLGEAGRTDDQVLPGG